MDTVQTILLVVVVGLTILLTIVGIQVLMVIIDLRRALKKLNLILEDSLVGGGLIRHEKLTKVLEMFGVKRKLESRGDSSTHLT